MIKDIQFLKELQQQLRYQNEHAYDGQAAPRFWVVGDYRMVECRDGCHDDYHVNLPNVDYYSGELDAFLKDFEKDELNEMSKEAQVDFKEICCEDSAMEWIKEYVDEDAELIPVREEHIIRPNTMFLTKEEAQKHIRLNHYHYSPKAHTYAMTAWRAPKVERLLNILENFDWESIDIKEDK